MKAPQCIALLTFFAPGAAQASEPVSLAQAIQIALSQNAEIAQTQAKASSEHSLIRSKFSPESPMIGLEYEKNMTLMETQMGPMKKWSLTQEIKFPPKYFLMARSQRLKAEMADQEVFAKKLEIRKKVVSAYFKLFSFKRILALIDASLSATRETSRVAEAKRAIGAAPQHDEMKAHVEETRVNTELLLAKEEHTIAETELALLLGLPSELPIKLEEDAKLALPPEELSAPKLAKLERKIAILARSASRRIRKDQLAIDEARGMKYLAAVEYAPDFRFMYQQAFVNAPPGAYMVSLELSVPFWFFLKHTSEASFASLALLEAEHRLAQSIRDTDATVKSNLTKALTRQTMLKIYETSLIPQATTTFNSSIAAYRAGRIGLLELLDSKRDLYNMRIGYYKMLAEFAETVAELEEKVGVSLSDLPFPEETGVAYAF